MRLLDWTSVFNRELLGRLEVLFQGQACRAKSMGWALDLACKLWRFFLHRCPESASSMRLPVVAALQALEVRRCTQSGTRTAGELGGRRLSGAPAVFDARTLFLPESGPSLELTLLRASLHGHGLEPLMPLKLSK